MDCYALIDFEKEKSYLFVPRQDNSLKIWMTVLSHEEWKKKYSLIDNILYVDQIEESLKSLNPDIIFLNQGVNSDSGLTTMVPEVSHYKNALPRANVDVLFMHNVLCESRVFKTPEEIEIMRWASKITCEGHLTVMRSIKPG